MAKTSSPLLPSTAGLLFQLGNRLRLARQRRGLTAVQVAERAGMSRMTLRSLERGGAGVTMGAYLTVMQVLGIEKDLNLVGSSDPLGRALQDARLPSHRRSERVYRRQATELSIDQTAEQHSDSAGQGDGRAPVKLEPPTHVSDDARGVKKRNLRREDAPRPIREQTTVGQGLDNLPREESRKWIEMGGYADSEKLADLIDLTKPLSKLRR